MTRRTVYQNVLLVGRVYIYHHMALGRSQGSFEKGGSGSCLFAVDWIGLRKGDYAMRIIPR